MQMVEDNVPVTVWIITLFWSVGENTNSTFLGICYLPDCTLSLVPTQPPHTLSSADALAVCPPRMYSLSFGLPSFKDTNSHSCSYSVPADLLMSLERVAEAKHVNSEYFKGFFMLLTFYFRRILFVVWLFLFRASCSCFMNTALSFIFLMIFSVSEKSFTLSPILSLYPQSIIAFISIFSGISSNIQWDFRRRGGLYVWSVYHFKP